MMHDFFSSGFHIVLSAVVFGVIAGVYSAEYLRLDRPDANRLIASTTALSFAFAGQVVHLMIYVALVAAVIAGIRMYIHNRLAGPTKRTIPPAKTMSLPTPDDTT